MGRHVLLPTGACCLMIRNYDIAPHIVDMENFALRIVRGDFRKGVISIPIRHGKSEFVNGFIGWLMISDPRLRILRVMENATTCEMEALKVLKFVRDWGPKLTGVQLEKHRCGLSHFMTTEGGELRSLGSTGSVESWTFDWIIIDDFLVDPAAIRNPWRREQAYNDLKAKFFSRINPTGNTRFLYVGSRRHPSDPQGRLFASNVGIKDPRERWYYHWSPAIIDEGTDHERVLWPSCTEFGTLEQLHAKRDELIEDGQQWQWHCFFQNDAVGSPDLLSFDPAWLKASKILYTFPSEALPRAKFKALVTDPSMGAGNEENDYFASLYLHIDETGVIYVDDCFISVCKPDLMIPMMEALVARHQDMDVAPFEDNGGGIYAAELVKRACDSRGLRFPAIFKHYGSSSQDEKVARITINLWEILMNNKLQIRDTPMGRILLRQLQQFPTAKRDGPDALATGIISLKEIL